MFMKLASNATVAVRLFQISVSIRFVPSLSWHTIASKTLAYLAIYLYSPNHNIMRKLNPRLVLSFIRRSLRSGS